MLVERPGYRIDSRTIKRGSRPSILGVSFMDSSNLCILASLKSSLLVLIWILSWCGIGACRARHDKAKVTEKGFHMRLILRFRFWRFLPVHPCGRFISTISLQNLHCLFATFPRVAFVVLFPTKLVSRNLDFICNSYGFPICK